MRRGVEGQRRRGGRRCIVVEDGWWRTEGVIVRIVIGGRCHFDICNLTVSIYTWNDAKISIMDWKMLETTRELLVRNQLFFVDEVFEDLN